MTFNRYEILTKHYVAKISQWDWEGIKDDALNNCMVDENQEVIGKKWLGTPFGIYPSGKVYTFWTSNQTSSDEIKDSCFSDAMDVVATKHGMFIDRDDDDIFACMFITELSLVKGWVTQDQAELGEKILSE